jgi:hypothetical protein
MIAARLDHLVLTAPDLAAGAAHVRQALGVPLEEGGRQPRMGSHSCLLALGAVYLEVIAPDPDTPPEAPPRWFDLDQARAPRLSHWAAACGDLEAALAAAPEGAGRPLDLTRGDLGWRMAVPEDGRLPYDGGFPALVEWQGAAHPAARLIDRGCRLTRLELTHPEAEALHAALAPLFTALPVSVSQGPPGLRAEVETPLGLRHLQ